MSWFSCPTDSVPQVGHNGSLENTAVFHILIFIDLDCRELSKVRNRGRSASNYPEITQLPVLMT